MPRKTYFQDAWLTDPQFQSWLRKGPDRETAICTVCLNKKIPIGSQGVVALRRHAGYPPYEHLGKKHKERLPVDAATGIARILPTTSSTTASSSVSVCTDQSTASSASSSTSLSSSPSTSSSSSSPSAASSASSSPASSQTGKKQGLVSDMLLRENVLDAEIRLCLKITKSKYSQRSVDDMQELLATMFPDSSIAQEMRLKKDKCGYIITHGIAPHFEELLLEEVSRSPFFALSFDESLNKNLQMGQMDILVRYWNMDKNLAETRYLTSEFMGCAKADDLMNSFQKGVERKFQDSKNLVHIGSDGPSVNIKFLKDYDEHRSLNELPVLLHLGTCGLHTIHGSLKAGEKESGWKIGKTLKAMSGILTDTPARRETFENLTETFLYPLPYCGHRWCENENCLERADVVWKPIKRFVKHLEKLPKSKQPGKGEGQQFLHIRQAVDDKLMQAKFKFLEFISHKFNEFLRGFQTDRPMIVFVCDALEDIVRFLLNLFIKRPEMQKLDTLLKLTKIDVSDASLYKPSEHIDVGSGASLRTSTYKKSPEFKANRLKDFHVECRKVLVAIIKHMLEKSPLKSAFMRFTKALNPYHLAEKSKEDSNVQLFSKMVLKLVETERLTFKEGDDAKNEYSKFLDEVVPRHKEKFLAFNKFEDRLDAFFIEILPVKDYKSLMKIVVLVCTIFHGQSSIERGFNANKELSSLNQNESSLMSLRMVHNHMESNDLQPHTVPITVGLRKSVQKARQRVAEQRKKEAEETRKSEKEKKRKIISDEITEVQAKKKFLQNSIDGLHRDADVAALDAAKKKDFELLERSNDLRSLIKTKEQEISDLDKMEQDLVTRRGSLM